ncbi:MAG TPA: sugar transferase [Bellilinea sp.]|nr:sugar transferase [Bellilinea sp.]
MVDPRIKPARRHVSKRIFDVIISSLVLVIFSPVMAAIALILLIKHGRPVIFSQPRPGLKGKVFTLYKFRSMSNEYDHSGKPLSDTQRITPFGRFLRATSLDELPELYNVLRGEMSLIGPRPLLVEYLPRYSAEQNRRHDVLPGISGWAQVNGRNALSWEQKFALDVWYVDHWSFWLDLKIIFMTIWAVLRRHNITPPGQSSMEEFLG